MLESILDEQLAEQGPWRMFFLAIAIGAVSIALAAVLGAGEDTSHLMVAFACIAAAPLMVKILQREENDDIVNPKAGELSLLARHGDMFADYGLYFIGMIVVTSMFFALFPGDTMTDVFSSQNQELRAIEGIRSSGNAVRPCGFMCLVENNMGVLVLTLIFSLAFGAGAIYVITWNATIVGVLIGSLAKQYAATHAVPVIAAYLVALPYALISLFPHGLFEVGAYLLGSLAGGMFSAAVIRGNWKNPVIIKDVVVITALSVVCIVVGAVIESAAL